MSCLGDRLTALVDGELDDDGRERALAHLACCDSCRGEAEALRRLKRRLHALKEISVDDGLLGRLYGLEPPAGAPERGPSPGPAAFSRAWPPQVKQDGPVPSDGLLRSLYRMDGPGEGEGAGPAHRRPRDSRPARGHGQAVQRRRMPRARYLVAGAAIAALGAGSAPYVNSAPARVPKVSPSWSQVSVHNGGVSQVRLPRRPDELKR